MAKDKNKPRPTEIVCVVDRSGSMSTTRTDAEGGFNSFINEQRKLDTGEPCHVTLWQFDNQIDCVWPHQLLTAVSPQPYRLVPRSNTRLLDAIGRAVSNVEVPKKTNVIVVIVTDGQENASIEYRLPAIKMMVEAKQELGWSFLFIGAGIDAFGDAMAMGISRNSTITTSADSYGYGSSYSIAGASVSSARRHGTKAAVTVDQQRTAAAHTGITIPDVATEDDEDEVNA